MSINILDSISPDKWDDFTDGNPYSNIFHTRHFVDIFNRSDKYTPHTFFLEEDGIIRASIVAVQTKVLGSFLSGFASRSVVYGGIIHDPSLNERYLRRHLGKLISTYDQVLRNKVLYTEIRNMTDPSALIIPMAQEKYKLSPHLNYFLDLTLGEKALLENVSQGLRKAIKKAIKSDIEISEIKSDGAIPELYNLVSQTYSKVHVPCFEIDVFKNAWNLLYPRKMIRMTLAKNQGRTVAARAALIYKGRLFDWFAGSNQEGDSFNVNALLAWDMIKWGCSNGLKLFDFGGAGDPNKPYGVREFKMKFGGRLVNFGRFTKIHSRPRYTLGYLAYSVLRRFLF